MSRGELRDLVLMDMAKAVSRLGTCNRLQVGAVLCQQYRVISTGYNGAPSSMRHCNHQTSDPCVISIHAEANAIVFAARAGSGSTQGASLYVTHSPCWECAKLVINAGIARVVYGVEYRRTEGLELLKRVGIRVDAI